MLPLEVQKQHQFQHQPDNLLSPSMPDIQPDVLVRELTGKDFRRAEPSAILFMNF